MLAPTFLFLCLFLSATNAARILGIFMTPSYSHQIVFQPIWKELSLRGHQVTVYTPFPLKDPTLTNLTEYDLSFSYEIMRNLSTFEESQSAAGNFDKLFQIYETISDAQLSHSYMQDLIRNANNDTFDLLLVEFLWHPMYAFKDLYNIPMVGITSLPLTIFGSDVLGMEKHPVVEPDLFLQFSMAKTFKERVLSWAYNWVYRLVLNTKLKPKLNAHIKKHFGSGMRSVDTITGEVNLVLGNYNFALQNVKPSVPMYVPISGIHVKPLQPLPDDLSQLMDSFKNDIIYFSLGTNVKSSQVNKNYLQLIFNVLGKLPYTVLWKYEKDQLPQNLPKNFVVRKWFPQQDVLGHPKVKLFVTQGGLQSIDEALSRKVPMMVLPFFGDQKLNADKVVSLGIAETINIFEDSEEEFAVKINKVLTGPKYKENIEKQSKIATDQPLPALDHAIYWIEYVLRHKGADHLKYAAVDLPFYIYYMLDVYLFMILMFSLLYFVGKRIVIISTLGYRFLKRVLVERRLVPSEEKEKKL